MAVESADRRDPAPFTHQVRRRRYPGRVRRLSVAIYLVAGLAFALTAAALAFIVNGVEFLPLRFLATAIAYSTPNLIVVGLILGADSRRFRFAIAAYAGVLLVLGIVNEALTEPAADTILAPLLFALLFGAPTLIVLALLNSRVRAVAPVLMAVIGPGVVGSILAIIVLENESTRRAAATVGTEAGISALGIVTIVGLIGLAVMGWVGLGAARWLAKAVDEQRISQDGLIVDLVWAFQSLVVAVYLQEAAVFAVLPFAVYKLVSGVGLHQIRSSLDQVPAQPLLLLRVFRPYPRSRNLLDDLANSWSYQGPIHLISAPGSSSWIFGATTTTTPTRSSACSNLLPTERILFLVDTTTRADELNGTIAAAWDRLLPDSPNGLGRPSRLSLLDVTGSEHSIAEAVLAYRWPPSESII